MKCWPGESSVVTKYKTKLPSSLLSRQRLGMYTEDQYFLVQAPNWVGTRAPLRFWTNGTVKGTF